MKRDVPRLISMNRAGLWTSGPGRTDRALTTCSGTFQNEFAVLLRSRAAPLDVDQQRNDAKLVLPLAVLPSLAFSLKRQPLTCSLHSFQLLPVSLGLLAFFLLASFFFLEAASKRRTGHTPLPVWGTLSGELCGEIPVSPALPLWYLLFARLLLRLKPVQVLA